jgi:nucleoid-associated protein YgaU
VSLPNPAFQVLALTTPRRFPATSRYGAVPIAQITASDGTVVTYLQRRFVPSAAGLATVASHTIVQGDRLDNLAARYLGDPEQYWRLCDANGAMRPLEVTETLGRTVLITLPEGVPGPRNA